jgi:iron(III) transport system ATP-binding protein
MSSIEVRGISKRFGSTIVLDDADLMVGEGSVTAILGASGSGKTTLLRIIAGFERVDAGTVTIGGRVVDDPLRTTRTVHAQHRGIGYVPQEGALFPHLTVAGNIGFGLERKQRARVADLIDLVGLDGLALRHPNELSGGQQQRVALARALAIEPRVILLDEPFASLDASLRASVRADVLSILHRTGTTAIIVTHDQDEALSMADRVAVMTAGRISVSAAPRELYLAPPDEVAARYLGDVNVLPAEVHGGVAHCALGDVPLRVAGAEPATPATQTARGLASAAGTSVLLRPEQLILRRDATAGGIPARVIGSEFYGHDAMVHIELATSLRDHLLARVQGDELFTAGDRVWVASRGGAILLP